jgi:TP901 family phage tail tape measure protein
MSLIGSLNIALSTNTSSFTKGMATARQGVLSLGGAASSVTPALAALGVGFGVVGVVLGIKRLISVGAGFEHQMQAVKAISGATGEEFAALSKEAQRLGASTQYTAKEAAAGMEILAQAGLNTNTILTAMEPTLNLAAAGGIEIAQAADVAVTSMTGMGIAADKLQNTVDVLAKAASASNADVLGIGEALNTVGPIAKAVDKGLEETVSAIEALSNAGIKGEEAGTSLRMILLKMADKTPEAQKALKNLGIETMDLQGNIRPLADIVDDFNAKMAGMGGGKKLEQLGRIFEARAASGFAALLGQGGDALRKFQGELSNATGEAARQAGARMDSLSGDWEKFTSAVDGLSITISQGANGWLRSIVQFATRSVDFINDLAPQYMRTLGAGMRAIGQMFSTTWTAIANLTTTIFGGSLATVKVTMKDVQVAIVTSLATIEFGFMHWQDVAALAGLKVIASVVTLGAQVAHVFTEVIPSTLDWLLNNWKNVFNTLVDFTLTVFINLGENIRESVKQIFDYISSGGTIQLDVKKMWKPLTDGFHNSIAELPQIAEREMGPLESALYADIKLREGKLGKEFSDFVGGRLTEFQNRKSLSNKPSSSFAEFQKQQSNLPVGVGANIERPKALERGTAEAFSASFGKGTSPALQEAKKQTKLQQKSAKETERLRILSERNAVVGLGF